MLQGIDDSTLIGVLQYMKIILCKARREKLDTLNKGRGEDLAMSPLIDH